MKKCNRCNSFIDWDKPFCPLCGSAETIDVPKPERYEPIRDVAPAAAENIDPQQVTAPIEPPRPPAPQLPPAPVAAVPPAPPIPAAAMIPPISLPVPPVASLTPVSPPVPPATLTDFQAILPPIPDVPSAGSISQIHNTLDSADSFVSLPSAPSGMISQIHQPQAPSLPPTWSEMTSSIADQSEDPLDAPKSELQSQMPDLYNITEPLLPEPQTDAAFDPFSEFLKEEKTPTPDVDAGHFDDPLAEILKNEVMGIGKPEVEDPIESLLKSGPQFDAGNSEKNDDDALFTSIDDPNEGQFQFPLPAPPSSDKNVIPNLPDDVKPNQNGNNFQDDFLRMFPGTKG